MKTTSILCGLIWLVVPCVPVTAQEKPAVAIIGTGTLAGTLGPALGQHGYAVVYGSRDPARESVQDLVARTGPTASAVQPREATARAEIIILAVPREVVAEVVGNLGDIDGRIIVDVSGGEKRVAPDGYLELAEDSTNSERIQSRHPNARVVRINLPSIAFFDEPLLLDERVTVLIAGNDPSAREAVARVMYDLGVDPWDAGPVRFSRAFDAINVMLMVPLQQGSIGDYALRLMPSIPLACFIDVSELFGFGRPYDLNDLPDFPRREPLIPCEEWRRRYQPREAGAARERS
jgi:8-hydroxy-5-deazaflavin:NADPH oxidoreductase